MNNGILHDYHGKMSMSGQIKIQEHKMQMGPARCVALVMVKLQTKIREDFTITEIGTHTQRS